MPPRKDKDIAEYEISGKVFAKPTDGSATPTRGYHCSTCGAEGQQCKTCVVCKKRKADDLAAAVSDAASSAGAASSDFTPASDYSISAAGSRPVSCSSSAIWVGTEPTESEADAISGNVAWQMAENLFNFQQASGMLPIKVSIDIPEQDGHKLILRNRLQPFQVELQLSERHDLRKIVEMMPPHHQAKLQKHISKCKEAITAAREAKEAKKKAKLAKLEADRLQLSSEINAESQDYA